MENRELHKIQVTISGCDDHTLFDVELTPTQYKGIRALASLSRRHSEYGCQPIISLRAINK